MNIDSVIFSAGYMLAEAEDLKKASNQVAQSVKETNNSQQQKHSNYFFNINPVKMTDRQILNFSGISLIALGGGLLFFHLIMNKHSK